MSDNNSSFPFWTPPRSDATDNGVFPLWYGEGGTTLTSQSHNFAVALDTSSTQGHRFIVAISTSNAQGHDFAVALDTSGIQSHNFAVALDTSGIQSHNFAVALDTSDVQGHRFVAAISVSNTQGHQFTVPPSTSIVKAQIVKQQDLNDLTGDLAVLREEPEQLKVEPVSRKSSEEAPTNQQRTEDAISSLKEWLLAAAQMQIVLGEKLKNRRVTVSASLNPSVRDAIGRLFNIDSTTVTYDMYKKALEWRSQLLKEGRNTTYGTRS